MSLAIGPVPFIDYSSNAAYNRDIGMAVPVQRAVEDTTPAGVREKDIKGIKPCQTCANRRYQDSSSDPGVSMKSPTKLSPEQAATEVVAHEREHQNREAAKAASEGRQVVSNDIRIFTSTCPECGRIYVSGGETRTVTKNKPDHQEAMMGELFKSLDVKV